MGQKNLANLDALDQNIIKVLAEEHRIVDSCLKYNLPKPKFEEFVGGFRVTLFKSIQKTRVKTSDLLLDLIKTNPTIAREEMAKALNLTIDGIDWNIRKLKNEEKLKRIGPDRGGYWEVVE